MTITPTTPALRRISTTRILAAIDRLRERHTELCRAQQWESAGRINDAIIRTWRKYHAAVEASGIEPQPQLGPLPFPQYFDLVSTALKRRGKRISEADARALYRQRKSVLDVIDNHKHLV